METEVMFLPVGLLEYFKIKEVIELEEVSSKQMVYEIHL